MVSEEAKAKFKQNLGIDFDSIPDSEKDKVLSEIDEKLDDAIRQELEKSAQLLKDIQDLQIEIEALKQE